MRILMLGWEFPPYFAGGIGMVCYELSKELARQGEEIIYLMPFGPHNLNPGFLKDLLIAENLVPGLTIKPIRTGLHAYITEEEYRRNLKSRMLHDNGQRSKRDLYGANLMEEIHKFAHRAMAIADFEDFDIIHCHDWLTLPAALGIKQRTGKPLVLHVHNTVYDRYLSGSNKVEWDIEQRGLKEADVVIAVSHYIKNTLVSQYDVDTNKILVIHNAAIPFQGREVPTPRIAKHDKIVLFAGRVTIQKGPDYFVRAARIVADHDPNTKFVMAGTGDMLHGMIELAADMGLSDRFLFSGFYSREDAEKLFSMASVFVMPSVSEPFGLVPLEAMYKGTPTIISKQSGCSEVLNHVLKVDFWDIHQLAEKILAVLRHEELRHELKQHGSMEVRALTWDKSAARVRELYNSLVHMVRV